MRDADMKWGGALQRRLEKGFEAGNILHFFGEKNKQLRNGERLQNGERCLLDVLLHAFSCSSVREPQLLQNRGKGCRSRRCKGCRSRRCKGAAERGRHVLRGKERERIC